MFKGLMRGAAAGAAGTTALNAITYLDMAWPSYGGFVPDGVPRAMSRA